MGSYFCLDVINPDNPQEAARQSFENYLYMRRQGLSPIPVLHAQEDIGWLYKMLDAGADYIALAARSLGTSFSHINDWYAQCWNKLADHKGRPLVKVHALGEGRYDTWSLFPWYSVDSTSWVYTSQRNGQIPVPGGRVVSHRNDARNEVARPDILSMDAFDHKGWLEVLQRYKIQPRAFDERTQASTIIASYLALQFYLQQERDVTALCPIAHKRVGLLSPTMAESLAKRVALELPELKFYPVIGNNHIAWAVMAYADVRRALVSYFYVEGGAKMSHNKNLHDFVYAPREVCASRNPMNKPYATLLEYID